MVSVRLEAFPEIIQALLIFRSEKELKVKEHIFFLILSYVAHLVLNFVSLGFVLNYLPIWLADRCFTLYCLFVILINLGIPAVDRFINFPVYTPLTDTLRKCIHLIGSKFSSKKAPLHHQQPSPMAPITPSSIPGQYINTQSAAAAQAFFTTSSQGMTTAHVASTAASTTESSLLFRPYGTPQPLQQRPFTTINDRRLAADHQTAATQYQLTHQDYPNYDLKRMLQESGRLDNEARQQVRMTPALSFAPSIQPPRPPVKRMDKTLWQLSRTDKMEDEFREEQVALMNENWEKVVTSEMRSVFRDRLTKWLSSKVFLPLASGITELDREIQPHSIAQCPEHMMATLLYLHPKVMILKESVYLPGYSDALEMRQHVADRIKDLGSCDNLQSYQWTKKSANVPGDDIILMHCFKTYMKYEMPNVVPPLIPEEGGIFLFLLVFFFITEELKDQIFHL